MGDDGVSSVIGTVLMLGITVTVFSGVSLVVLAEVSENADSVHADLSVLEGEEALLLRHGGGEAVSLATGHLLVNVEGSEQNVPLSQFSGETSDPDSLAIGDSICVSCLYPGQEVLGVVVVAGDSLLLAHGERGTPQGAALPDLAATNLTADPATPWNGTTVTFQVSIENVGDAASVASTVRFLIDDVEVDSVAIGPLAPDASALVNGTWTAATGTLLVTAVVDPAGLITEADEDNNQAALSLDVTPGTEDPGAPFEDSDGDGVFENDIDILLTVAAVADGTHDAGDHGLVIPASIGPLAAASWDIDGNGTHRILVDLDATGGDLNVAGLGDVHLDGTFAATGAISVTGDALLLNDTVLQSGGNLLARGGGDAYLVGATMTASGTLTTGTTGSGTVDATGLDATAADLAYVQANNAELDASQATLTSTGYRSYIIAGTITAPDLTVQADSWTYVYAISGTAEVTGASLNSDSDYAFLVASGDVTATSTTVTAPVIAYAGSIGGDISADDLIVTATTANGYAYLYAPGGAIQADRVDADGGFVYLNGAGGITSQDSDLDGGTGTVYLLTEADIDIQGSTLRGDVQTLGLDNAANELFIQDTCFLDSNDDPTTPTIQPDGVTITGTPACGGPAVSDPGFPFEDTDQDGGYTQGVDTAIDPAEFDDGTYDAGSNGLVIPSSFGPLTATVIDLQSVGPMRIDVALTATDDAITIDAGELDVAGITLTTQTNDRDITLTHSGLDAAGTTFESRGHLELDGDATDLTGASLTTLNNNKNTLITSTTLTAPNVAIDARGHLTVTATGAVDLDGATIDMLVDAKDIEITTTGDIGLDTATVSARGHMDLTGDDVHLEGLDLDMLNNGKHLTVDATGWIHGDSDTDLETRGKITFEAEAIRMESVTIAMLNNNQNLAWTASAGSIDMDGAQIETRGKAFFTADDDIWFRDGSFNGLRNGKETEFTGADIHFEDSSVHNLDELIANTSGTVYGSASTDFQDDDDLMDVEPDGAHNNTPAGVWT